jgi:hypothetical protein
MVLESIHIRMERLIKAIGYQIPRQVEEPLLTRTETNSQVILMKNNKKELLNGETGILKVIGRKDNLMVLWL